MTLRIVVNTNDRDECRAALSHIFHMHPGLSKEHREGDLDTPTPTPAASTPAASTPVADGTTDPQIGVELDARGVPWCEEVHASTRSKTKGGDWTKRRGVSGEEVERVENEAVAALAATPAPSVPTEAPVAPTPMPGAVAAMPGVEAPAPISYEEVTGLYAEMHGAGTLTPEMMTPIYAELGINPQQLDTNETMRASLYERLVQIKEAQTAAAAAPAMPGLPGA